MNAFQILDENKNAIKINELDRQACELWNKEVDKKWYAYPQHEPETYPTEEYKSRWDFLSSLTNWFDKIGWIIADKECEDWDKLIEILMEPFSNFSEEEQKYVRTEYVPIAGYIQLIEFWKSRNYKPKCVKE